MINRTTILINYGKIYSMREKVDAIDYKYFVEVAGLPNTKIMKEKMMVLKKKKVVFLIQRMNL